MVAGSVHAVQLRPGRSPLRCPAVPSLPAQGSPASAQTQIVGGLFLSFRLVRLILSFRQQRPADSAAGRPALSAWAASRQGAGPVLPQVRGGRRRVHGLWRPALPDVRRAGLQLPGGLQVPADLRLPQRQFLRPGHQRRPLIPLLLLDKDRHSHGKELHPALFHLAAELLICFILFYFLNELD